MPKTIDSDSGFRHLKHIKWLQMLFRTVPSPLCVTLSDAMLEEKRKQYEEVQAVREMMLRRRAARGDR